MSSLPAPASNTDKLSHNPLNESSNYNDKIAFAQHALFSDESATTNSIDHISNEANEPSTEDKLSNNESFESKLKALKQFSKSRKRKQIRCKVSCVKVARRTVLNLTPSHSKVGIIHLNEFNNVIRRNTPFKPLGFASDFTAIPKGCNHLQILPVADLSTAVCVYYDGQQIHIYDPDNNDTINPKFMECLKKIFPFCLDPDHKIILHKVQQSTDKVVMAMACAVTIALGLEPSLQVFIKALMRNHLMNIFETQKLSSFPIESRKRKLSSPIDDPIPVKKSKLTVMRQSHNSNDASFESNPEYLNKVSQTSLPKDNKCKVSLIKVNRRNVLNLTTKNSKVGFIHLNELNNVIRKNTPFRPLGFASDFTEISKGSYHLQIIPAADLSTAVCVYYDGKKIHIYDPDNKETINPKFMTFLKKMFPYYTDPVQNIVVHTVQPSSDRVVMAITCAVTIALGLEPSMQVFIKESMRNHLMNIFETHKLPSFPVESRSNEIYGTEDDVSCPVKTSKLPIVLDMYKRHKVDSHIKGILRRKIVAKYQKQDLNNIKLLKTKEHYVTQLKQLLRKDFNDLAQLQLEANRIITNVISARTLVVGKIKHTFVIAKKNIEAALNRFKLIDRLVTDIRGKFNSLCGSSKHTIHTESYFGRQVLKTADNPCCKRLIRTNFVYKPPTTDVDSNSLKCNNYSASSDFHQPRLLSVPIHCPLNALKGMLILRIKTRKQACLVSATIPGKKIAMFMLYRKIGTKLIHNVAILMKKSGAATKTVI